MYYNQMAIVQFKDNPKDYIFKVVDEDLEKGDEVVVETQFGTQIATFSHYTPPQDKGTKWVIQKVDHESHKKRVEDERERQKILQQLEAKRKENEKLKEYEEVAKGDPEAKELLNQYHKLK